MTDVFVSNDWLKHHQHDENVRVVDGSWHLASANRDARAEFVREHITGAMHFDIDAIAAPDAALPRTVPDPAGFGHHMDRLGIRRTDHVVVYDVLGLYSAPRVWWMFRLFGHERVSILAGGLPAWKASGGAIDSGEVAPVATGDAYVASHRPDLFSEIDRVAAASRDGGAQIVDVRATAGFAGTDAPRTGHIPGSLNLPFGNMIDAAGGLLPADRLTALFADAGLGDGPLVFTCGSGVTACIGALAAEVAGRRDWSVFGGSWAEWSRRTDLPVERS